MEEQFASLINAEPDNRDHQLIYADWLDEQGDPRGEAWRVLVGEERSPFFLEREKEWDWYVSQQSPSSQLDRDLWKTMHNPPWNAPYGYKTFFAAMDAAAVAWVRCHRDPEFGLVEIESEYDADRAADDQPGLPMF